MHKKISSQLSPYSPGGCFIATAVYGSQNYKLEIFRNFRDSVLLKHKLGKSFVQFYYKVSPGIANYIRKRKLIKSFVLYLFIEPIYKLLKLILDNYM
jgi:hypothetical protein